MRVTCTLNEIQKDLRLTKARLERDLGMDSRTIDKLLADSDDDPWRLDREMVRRLVLFAHGHGYEAFRVEPHTIWRSFQGSAATIFRGPTKADAPVENHLVSYLELLHCEVHTSTSPDGIEEVMKEKNCLIIGSPKANRASEVALAKLWGAEPFISTPTNRARIPFSILGMPPSFAVDSAVLKEGPRHGIEFQLPGRKESRFLKVDWYPPEKYGAATGRGQDSAIVVACHRPFGTELDITTIVLSGYTGLATFVAAQEVTSGGIVDIDLDPGRPNWAAMKFNYQKRRQTSKSLDNLRQAEERSAVWGPPWDKLFGH